MPLTDTKIRNLKPKEKPYKVADGGGLYVQVTPNGSKLWRCRYRFGGVEKLLSFGAYPVVSLERGREKRFQAKKRLTDGIDPRAREKQWLLDHYDSITPRTMSATSEVDAGIMLETMLDLRRCWTDSIENVQFRYECRDLLEAHYLNATYSKFSHVIS